MRYWREQTLQKYWQMNIDKNQIGIKKYNVVENNHELINPVNIFDA